MIESGEENKQRCGYVAIVGRPNVGKSTLLNHLLGHKLSITSRRPQTTRHRLLGIKTHEDHQIIYVDTPGFHDAKQHKKAINRHMNRTVLSTLEDVDAIIFVVDELKWTDEDQLVVDQLRKVNCPIILVINKIDKIENKSDLLPHMETLSQQLNYVETVPVSALRGQQLAELEECVIQQLPESMHFYPEDQITDKAERFLAAEIVREKIIRQLGQELPYQVAVEIESFKREKKVLHIDALIHVERAGQKAIVIGEKGEKLKSIGIEARLDMEALFDSKVMLRLWVKVKSGWSDDERALKSLGFYDAD